MDTYGGALNAAVNMQEALSQTKARTITYIDKNAGSAGALLAISTKEIYMAPVSAIGAAAPVSSGGEDIPATLNEKVVSYFSGYFRAAAQENGHNPDIAEAFINKDKSVVISGTTVHEKGRVLTFSARQAIEKFGGETVLANGIADSIPDVLKQAKIGGDTYTVEPTGFERLAFWITQLAPLFLLGGILGAYIEFKTPGFGLPGFISAICFGLFFLGHYVAGLAGWETVVLFIIGLALIISELAVHPGTIIPGLAGLFLVVGAIIWTMVDRYPSQGWELDPEMFIRPFINLGIAGVLAILGIAVLAKYLPETSLYHRFVLATPKARGPAFSPSVSEYTRLCSGDQGVARSILRPSGTAEFKGELFDVISTGEFVEMGTTIRVVAVEGSRIIVEPVRAVA
jgi:membrane-bound serine protease (ClpP class)